MQPGQEPASPCRRQCRLNEQRVCSSCGRTINEITTWTSMSTVQKQQCVEDAAARLDALDDALFD